MKTGTTKMLKKRRRMRWKIQSRVEKEKVM